VSGIAGALKTAQFWVIVSQVAVALVTAWMAYETRRVANETQRSVALIGIQLREDKPLVKAEAVPNFKNLCLTQVLLKNIGRKEARDVKWRLYANLVNTARGGPERRELTNGVIPEVRAFIGPEDTVVLSNLDFSPLKDLRLTHRLYSIEFMATYMTESLLLTDASLPSLALDALCAR